ncbi:MAG: hypothetical protein AB4372_12255 [Xenococcus sp. (in: cyanobacteria)]
MATIKLYKLFRGEDRFVKWNAPDGQTYSIDALNPAPEGQWAITLDSQGKPVMAYRPRSNGPSSDGELVVSLDGAPSHIATLLHEEDDYPRKYYFATDVYHNNPLDRPAFILRAEGISDMPVQRWVGLRVMVVDP